MEQCQEFLVQMEDALWIQMNADLYRIVLMEWVDAVMDLVGI